MRRMWERCETAGNVRGVEKEGGGKRKKKGDIKMTRICEVM